MRPLALPTLLFALLAVWAPDALADPFTVSTQGVLRDPLGNIVPDGSYNLAFRLYEVETGGSAVWNETHSGVQVKQGVFAVELGETSSLSSLGFDKTYWLSISINSSAELAPRTKFTNTAYTMSVVGASNIFPSSGNVGIGTLTPATELYVSGSGNTYAAVNSPSNKSAGYAFEADNTRKWEVKRAPDNSLRVTESGAGDVITVQPGGNVGIGTTSPAAKLHVAASGDTTVAVTVDGQIRSGGNDGGLFLGNSDDRFIGGHSTNKLGIKAGGEWRLTVQSDGNVGIGTTSPTQPLEVAGNLKLSSGGVLKFSDGTTLSTGDLGDQAGSLASADTLTVQADSDADGAGEIRLATGDTTRMVIKNDGKVGIGTSDPSAALDVAGDINFSGNLYQNGAKFETDVWTRTPSGADIYYSPTPAGKVGIGTTAPAFSLDVNGSLNATNLYKNGQPFVVTSPWTTGGSPPTTYSRHIVQDYLGFGSVPSGFNPNIWMGDMRVRVSPTVDQGIMFTGGNIRPIQAGSATLGRTNRYWAVTVVRTLYSNNTTTSDRATKRNIQPVVRALDTVMRLQGVEYDINPATHPFYKGRELTAAQREQLKNNLGFVAQDLEETMPEMVGYEAEAGMYTIRNYEQLFPVLTEAIKELKTEGVDELDGEVTDLEKGIQRLAEGNP